MLVVVVDQDSFPFFRVSVADTGLDWTGLFSAKCCTEIGVRRGRMLVNDLVDCLLALK